MRETHRVRGADYALTDKKFNEITKEGPVLFALYRKRGFSLALEILDAFPDGAAKEVVFFDALKDCGSYLNEFYRVKEDLLKYSMIGYRLDGDYDKVIFLTEEGREVLHRLDKLNEFMMECRSKKGKN